MAKKAPTFDQLAAIAQELLPCTVVTADRIEAGYICPVTADPMTYTITRNPDGSATITDGPTDRHTGGA